MSIASSIWNIVLGIIISIYLLMDKENSLTRKKVVTSLFNEKHTTIILDLANRTNLTFASSLVENRRFTDYWDFNLYHLSYF